MKLINRKEIPFYCSITVTRVFYYVISVPDLCGMRPAAGSKVASTRHPAPGTRKMLPGPGSLFPGSFYPAPGTWHPGPLFPIVPKIQNNKVLIITLFLLNLPCNVL